MLRLFRMSVSMVTLLFSANYFGVSMQRDVWVLIIALISSVSGALFGPINETFRAKFIFIKEHEGEAKAVSMTFSLITWMTLILCFVGFILAIFRVPICELMYPDEIDKSSIGLFGTLLLIMLPTLLLNQWTNIGISILNTYEVYYIPEIVGSFTCLTNISLIILLAPSIGIFSLAVSNYFSALLLLGVVIYYLNKISALHDKAISGISFKGFLSFLLFASPFYFPYFVGQCNSIVEKWLSGLLGQGMISSLDYARQFTVVIQGVLSGIISTLMLPLLSRSYVRNEKNEYNKTFYDNLSACFAILSVTITVLFGAANPLCEFFFDRGSIPEDMQGIITGLMQWFAVAFVGVALYIIMGNAMLASNQGKKYATIGVGVQLVVISSNIVLIRFIGINSFPLTMGISHLAGSIIMFHCLDFDNAALIVKKTLRYISIICLIGGCLWLFNYYFNIFSSFIQLALNIPLLCILVLVFSRHLDINAYDYLKKFIH